MVNLPLGVLQRLKGKSLWNSARSSPNKKATARERLTPLEPPTATSGSSKICSVENQAFQPPEAVVNAPMGVVDGKNWMLRKVVNHRGRARLFVVYCCDEYGV